MFRVLTVVVAALAAGYIGYIVWERFYYASLRKKLKKVVHVNGIRGKSTVTRLIDAGCRGCGLCVLSKTTGTLPVCIGTDNRERPIVRHAPANIREQQRTLRRAVKEGAEVLVVECMAVDPELQYVCEHRILHSDAVVITNVRPDHLDVMGDTPEKIAHALSSTVPDGGTLVLGENGYRAIFDEAAKKRGAKVVVAEEYAGDDLGTFPENVATALAVCDALGLDREKFFTGMQNYRPDVGAFAEIRRGNTLFFNAFAANDPESTLTLYRKVCENYPAGEIAVLVNSRADREFRIGQHLEMLQKMEKKTVYLVGAGTAYLKRELEKRGIACRVLKKYEELSEEKYVFGCGNIAGDGEKIVEWFREGKENG